MRIGVLSDSHGFTGRLSTVLMVLDAEHKPLDALIHLGDGYYDLQDLGAELPPVYQVAGNCDHFCSDTLNIVTLSNARLLLTHGHYQHVKAARTICWPWLFRKRPTPPCTATPTAPKWNGKTASCCSIPARPWTANTPC